MSQSEKDHLVVIALIFEYGSERPQYRGNEDGFCQFLFNLLTPPMREYVLEHFEKAMTHDAFRDAGRAAGLV